MLIGVVLAVELEKRCVRDGVVPLKYERVRKIRESSVTSSVHNNIPARVILSSILK